MKRYGSRGAMLLWATVALSAFVGCTTATGPSAGDGGSNGGATGSTPSVTIRTNSGTTHRVTYESFRWRNGDLSQTTHSDLRITQADCAVITITRDRTDSVDYRGRTVSPCRNRPGHEFVVRHSGGTTRAWETSDPSIAAATGRDFNGASVSVGISSLDSVTFSR